MKTLHLNLKRKYFLMILKLIKKAEYREIKEYYIPRFFNYKNHLNFVLSDKELKTYFVQAFKANPKTTLLRHLKDFDSITFSNGMARDAPRFEIEFNGFEINEGKPEWGAKEGKRYFVLLLGNIISRNETALKLLNQAK